ncbi:MAG: BON domain-containing protein [Candidatus Methylopumilus sp.]
MKISRYLFLFFVSLLLTGCPAAIIGSGAVAIDTTADRRTHGVILEDSNIELKSFALIQKIEGSMHTNVTSYNGHVLILGQVPTEEIKNKIASSIKDLPNVKSISNELTMGPVASISTRAQDTLITSNVKARFFKENKVSPFYVKIITENKVVYLMGILSKEEAKEAETIAKNTSQVSKVVTLFEIINTQK